VSTIREIQEAIQTLPEIQRLELINWLHSEYDELSIEEEAELLAEAEVGEKQIKEGRGIPLEELRKQTRTWIIK
jgi:hypothetical protein